MKELKNIEMENNKIFEHPLEQRCFDFASDVRIFCRKINQDIINVQDIRQLVKSSGSICANYIEANEKLGEGDLRFRIKVARKEAKETILWLGLIHIQENNEIENERQRLIKEASELKAILSSILNKLK
ncbi:MAG: four helix bundle protein [Chitinophagaceae bacterium]|nr:four helix bundle protein [Chitinophagaceae bacterium]